MGVAYVHKHIDSHEAICRVVVVLTDTYSHHIRPRVTVSTVMVRVTVTYERYDPKIQSTMINEWPGDCPNIDVA